MDDMFGDGHIVRCLNDFFGWCGRLFGMIHFFLTTVYLRKREVYIVVLAREFDQKI